MALSSPEFPIIEFTKDAMKPGTATWDMTREHVLKALEEHGFFKASFKEITQELYTALFSSSEKFFDLPKDTKLCVSSSEDLYEGYLSDLPLAPLLEALGQTDPLNYQSVQNLTHRIWPQGDPIFSETLHSYATLVVGLEKTVREMIFRSYGVEKDFEENSMKYSMSLAKYNASMMNEATLATPTHYDMNLITIIQEKGLGFEVQTKDGQWISPNPTGSSLIVLLGESFHGWSNGRLKCSRHRTKSGCQPVYSVELYSVEEGKIEIPSKLVDEKHPLLFKPFDYAGLLRIFMRESIENSPTINDDNIVSAVRIHYAI